MVIVQRLRSPTRSIGRLFERPRVLGEFIVEANVRRDILYA